MHCRFRPPMEQVPTRANREFNAVCYGAQAKMQEHRDTWKGESGGTCFPSRWSLLADGVRLAPWSWDDCDLEVVACVVQRGCRLLGASWGLLLSSGPFCTKLPCVFYHPSQSPFRGERRRSPSLGRSMNLAVSVCRCGGLTLRPTGGPFASRPSFRLYFAPFLGQAFLL